MEEEKKFGWSSIQFPIVRNVQPQTIASQISGMTNEEVREAMTKMFKRIEEETGYTIAVERTDSPVSALLPKDKKDENELH